jgi:hypothetical protein
MIILQIFSKNSPCALKHTEQLPSCSPGIMGGLGLEQPSSPHSRERWWIFFSKKATFKPDIVAYACISSPQEAKAGGLGI